MLKIFIFVTFGFYSLLFSFDQTDIKPNATIKNLKLSKDYVTYLKESGNDYILIEKDDCVFSGYGKAVYDEKNEVDATIHHVVCKNNEYSNYRYSILGSLYADNDLQENLSADTKWIEEDKNLQFIVKKGTPVRLHIDLLFSKEIEPSGNYALNYLLFKNGKQVGFKHSINVKQIRRKGYLKRSCTPPDTDPVDLIVPDINILNCEQNIDGKKQVQCKLTVFDVKEFDNIIKTEADNGKCVEREPSQIKKTFEFNAVLGDNKKSKRVMLNDKYSIEYVYYFIPNR